jgi:hypothetical protein
MLVRQLSKIPNLMPRRNRIDPWGDLHAVAERGLFTGNRGCLVDDHGAIVRHHGSALWIVCRTSFRGWRHPLAAPRRWTPIFFLDDAVALAAGHRPCATCRRSDYVSYRDAVSTEVAAPAPLLAKELDARLVAERHRRGRGLARAADRLTWMAEADDLPDGSVIVVESVPRLIVGDRTRAFGFGGWHDAAPRPSGDVTVLTPPTSVGALRRGFVPTLHGSAR